MKTSWKIASSSSSDVSKTGVQDITGGSGDSTFGASKEMEEDDAAFSETSTPLGREAG